MHSAFTSLCALIRLAGAHMGVIHLLMTDVVIPEMNRRDLAKHLLTSYPSLTAQLAEQRTAAGLAPLGRLRAVAMT